MAGSRWQSSRSMRLIRQRLLNRKANKQKGRIWFGFASRVLLKILFQVSCDWLEEKLQKNFYCKEKNLLKWKWLCHLYITVGSEHCFYLQSQSKLLGHFCVSLSPQCWCTRFGDWTAINNFERDKESTRRKKQERLVKVSQLFLSESVG